MWFDSNLRADVRVVAAGEARLASRPTSHCLQHTGHLSQQQVCVLPSSPSCQVTLTGPSYKGNTGKWATALQVRWWIHGASFQLAGTESQLEEPSIFLAKWVHSPWPLTNRLLCGFPPNHLQREFYEGTKWGNKVIQGGLRENKPKTNS